MRILHVVLLLLSYFFLTVPITWCSFALIPQLRVTGHKLSWKTQTEKAFQRSHGNQLARTGSSDAGDSFLKARVEWNPARGLCCDATSSREENSCNEVQGGQQNWRKHLSLQAQAPCTAERKPFKNHSEPLSPLNPSQPAKSKHTLWGSCLNRPPFPCSKEWLAILSTLQELSRLIRQMTDKGHRTSRQFKINCKKNISGQGLFFFFALVIRYCLFNTLAIHKFSDPI